MSRYRIYPSKNSVIFEDDTDRNVGQNEVFELWHGVSGVTRTVLKWDWSDYIELFNAGIAPPLSSDTITAMKFVFTCTYPILEAASQVGDAQYDIQLIDDGITDFEEGLGWWHDGPNIITGYTNWVSANSVTNWASPGATGGAAFASATTSADRDSVQIIFSCDTIGERTYVWDEYVRDNSQVLCLFKFNNAYEALTGETPGKKRLFYSRHTNTVFKPYIEVEWDDTIREDRFNVVEGVSNSLYLFTYNDDALADPVSVNSVEILGQISTAITKVSTGIYKYDYVLPVGSGGTGTVITDTWNITFTGSLTGNIVQSFTGLQITSSAIWSGGTALEAQKYVVSMPNLEDEYTRSDRLYLRVLFRPEYSRFNSILKNAEFRVHIPDKNTGDPLLMMIDWTPISHRNENFFMLYLDWFLIGKSYQIDVRYNDGHALVIDNTERKFKVVS